MFRKKGKEVRTIGAEVQVLISKHSSNTSLPSSVMVMPVFNHNHNYS